MFDKPFLPSRGLRVVSAAALGIALAVLGGSAFSAQDKYTLRVPNGLAFSDFRGYENWQVVAVSQTEDLLKVIVANPAMIDAYRAGVPGNGKPFPDGSKIPTIEWKPKKSTEAPYFVTVPDNQKNETQCAWRGRIDFLPAIFGHFVRNAARARENFKHLHPSEDALDESTKFKLD